MTVGAGGVGEHLGEGSQHVGVVVEDLVVVPARAQVPLHEDLRWGVDHDLPHVVVGEEGLERAVAGEVPHRPFDHRGRIGEVERPHASLVVHRPLGHGVDDEGAEGLGLTVGVEGQVAGPLLHEPFDLLEW